MRKGYKCFCGIIFIMASIAFANTEYIVPSADCDAKSTQKLQLDTDGYYIVSSCSELFAFANDTIYADKNVKLTANIVVNDSVLASDGSGIVRKVNSSASPIEWVPIGGTKAFSGIFDGKGYTIRGLYYNNEKKDFAGLFSLTRSATIMNVGLEDSYIKAGSLVGGIVGGANATSVIRCYNKASLKGTKDVGGIVGIMLGTSSDTLSSVEQSVNLGWISGSSSGVGGIAGEGRYGIIRNSVSAGRVTGSSKVGGIIGNGGTGVGIEYSYASVIMQGSSQTGCIAGYLNETIADSKVVFYNSDICLDSAVGAYSSSNVKDEIAGIGTIEIAKGLNPGNFSTEIWTLGSTEGDTTLRAFDVNFKLPYPTDLGNAAQPVVPASFELFLKDKKYYLTKNLTLDDIDSVKLIFEDISKEFNTKNEEVLVFSSENDITESSIVHAKYYGMLFSFDLSKEGVFLPHDGVYLISTAVELKYFANIVKDGKTDAEGVLMQNIELNGSSEDPWEPIGTSDKPFTGAFNGRDTFGNIHTIYDVYIDSSGKDYVGLFGKTAKGSSILNVEIGNAHIVGRNYVGGVVGYCGGKIKNTYSHGYVQGNNSVGGIAGYASNEASLYGDFNDAEVSGKNYIGGIAGKSDGTVSNCSNMGIVQGSVYVDCIVGDYTGTVINNINDEKICHFDATPSTEDSVFISAPSDGCVMSESLSLDTKDSCYEIATCGDLYKFADMINTDGKFNICAKLTADITVNTNVLKAENNSEANLYDATNPPKAWVPIGNKKAFMGIFDGQGHVIRGLYFDNSTAQVVGLIGYATTLLGAGKCNISNVGIEDSYFNAMYDVGGIVGYAYSGCTVSNTYNAGTVLGSGSAVGGIAGVMGGTLTNSYNRGYVKGNASVGGIAGQLGETASYPGSVSMCYNIGQMEGTTAIGGIVGVNLYGSTISNVYNAGSVYVSSYGSQNVGGIVGENVGNLSSAYNIADVYGFKYIGGVIGYNYSDAKVSKAYSSSDVFTGVAFGYNEASASADSVAVKSSLEIARGKTLGFDTNIWGIGESIKAVVRDTLYYPING